MLFDPLPGEEDLACTVWIEAGHYSKLELIDLLSYFYESESLTDRLLEDLFDEDRIDRIGQDGATGEHYDEI